MLTKLKGLKISSTDLVDQGANPDAHIRLFKRKDDEKPSGEETFLQKFADKLTASLGEAFRKCAPNTISVEKEARSFTNYIYEEAMRDLTREMWGYCDALSDSLRSIIVDNDKNSESKAAMMNRSIDQFTAAIGAAIPKWACGKSANTAKPAPESNTNNGTAGITKSNNKEETENMKFDKSKMTPEEIQTLENFEKRYGIEDDTSTNDVNKSVIPSAPEPAELDPEVKKAIEDFEAVKKAQLAEIEALKKSLEMEKLAGIAKKYEVLGKNAEELAKKLYDLKKAGGTVYADYVALLDENVTTVEKSGLFTAVGSDNGGSSDIIGKINAAAGEIAKAGAASGMTPEAVVKAWENNPELAAEYEAEYRNGGK